MTTVRGKTGVAAPRRIAHPGAGLVGALIAPPLAAATSARLPTTFHPFIGNVASMTVSTALTVAVLRLIPGFAS
ncbi:hypothetical protein [Spirillospora sp. CA-128828]|uniref:hypothetical protein n=1 Tax=Spirillospora sp. CA-128828 TaxID=3240033 RepID=UPI003D8EBC5D